MYDRISKNRLSDSRMESRKESHKDRESKVNSESKINFYDLSRQIFEKKHEINNINNRADEKLHNNSNNNSVNNSNNNNISNAFIKNKKISIDDKDKKHKDLYEYYNKFLINMNNVVKVDNNLSDDQHSRLDLNKTNSSDGMGTLKNDNRSIVNNYNYKNNIFNVGQKILEESKKSLFENDKTGFKTLNLKKLKKYSISDNMSKNNINNQNFTNNPNYTNSAGFFKKPDSSSNLNKFENNKDDKRNNEKDSSFTQQMFFKHRNVKNNMNKTNISFSKGISLDLRGKFANNIGNINKIYYLYYIIFI